MILFFDTETTGLPRNYKAPVTDLANWPRVVQIAWLLTDDAGAEITSAERIIRPDGYEIPADSARVHGITTERAFREGAPLAEVLGDARAAIDKASVLVAHNMSFDEKILGAELLRAGLSNVVESKTRLCTMQASTDFCALPGRYGYKWPSLQELYARLFQESFDGAHQALADVRACARCFVELRRLGVM
jgi:DNA polymerase-3 subunit epsilon